MPYARERKKSDAFKSKAIFDQELAKWLLQNEPGNPLSARTIGAVDGKARKGRPYLWVQDRIGNYFHLNADTTSEGVRQYLKEAADAANWLIIRNDEGTWNKAVIKGPIKGFYLYREEPLPKHAQARSSG